MILVARMSSTATAVSRLLDRRLRRRWSAAIAKRLARARQPIRDAGRVFGALTSHCGGPVTDALAVRGRARIEQRARIRDAHHVAFRVTVCVAIRRHRAVRV
jgi:hypothetical protein